MLIDLHTHTDPLSWDSQLNADELVERSKAAGLDGIMLSEHDWAWNPDDVRALAARHNFVVLHGIEVNTDGGHVLIVGPARYTYAMRRPAELARMVREADGAMWGAHPYRRHYPQDRDDEAACAAAVERAAANEALQLVSAVEVVNGRSTPRENLLSHRIAERLALPGTAGTDSHRIEDIGTAATYFDRAITSAAELAEEIRAGRCWPVDLTRGALIEDARYHAPPAGLAPEPARIPGSTPAPDHPGRA